MTIGVFPPGNHNYQKYSRISLCNEKKFNKYDSILNIENIPDEPEKTLGVWRTVTSHLTTQLSRTKFFHAAKTFLRKTLRGE